MRLPRLSPSVERTKPGATAVPSAEIPPEQVRSIGPSQCGMNCEPGGRCPAGCTCSSGVCQPE